MVKSVSFYPLGDFLAARVSVSKKLFFDKSVEDENLIRCKPGYEIYYSIDTNELKNASCGKNIIETIREALKKNKGANKLYLYCINTGEYKIEIPFGIGKTEEYEKCCYTIISECKHILKLVEKMLGGFMNETWNEVKEGELRYDYVSEFFVDRDHRMGGLSIAFRDEIFEKCSEDIPGSLECVLKDLNENRYKDVFEFSISNGNKSEGQS